MNQITNELPNNVRLVTSWNDEGIITQHLDGIDPFVERVSKWICNTRDAGIKKALIELGWTPPGESNGRLGQFSAIDYDTVIGKIINGAAHFEMKNCFRPTRLTLGLGAYKALGGKTHFAGNDKTEYCNGMAVKVDMAAAPDTVEVS